MARLIDVFLDVHTPVAKRRLSFMVLRVCDSPRCLPVPIEYPEMFKDEDGGFVLTWQPYELDARERRLRQEYCSAHGLTLRLRPWYSRRYPGWSVLMVVG